MRNKTLVAFCLIAAMINLTACQSQKQTNNRQTIEKSGVTQKQTPKRLIVKSMSDTEKSSAISIYGSMKYGDAWKTAYSDAKKNRLSISVKNRTGFNWIKKGRGYIYEVTGNGQENKKKNLGVASLSEIASYLNEHNQVKAVEKLATKTTLAAEVTSDKYGVKGDDGLALVPTRLWGTWYNYKGKKLVITDHTVNGEEIHHISNSGVAAESLDQTKKWARARIENINGLNCYHAQTLNAQDFGLLYSVQKDNGNTAVVTYSVDTGHYTATYWKSTKIAKEHRNAEFKTLN